MRKLNRYGNVSQCFLQFQVIVKSTKSECSWKKSELFQIGFRRVRCTHTHTQCHEHKWIEQRWLESSVVLSSSFVLILSCVVFRFSFLALQLIWKGVSNFNHTYIYILMHVLRQAQKNEQQQQPPLSIFLFGPGEFIFRYYWSRYSLFMTFCFDYCWCRLISSCTWSPCKKMTRLTTQTLGPTPSMFWLFLFFIYRYIYIYIYVLF